jgi:hypothetical protein
LIFIVTPSEDRAVNLADVGFYVEERLQDQLRCLRIVHDSHGAGASIAAQAVSSGQLNDRPSACQPHLLDCSPV